MAKMTDEEKALEKAQKAAEKAEKKKQKETEKALKKFEKKAGMSYQECVSQMLEDMQNGREVDPKLVKLIDKTQNSILDAELDCNNATQKAAANFEKKTGQSIESYIQSKQPQPEAPRSPRAQEEQEFAPIGTRDVYGNKIEQPTASTDKSKDKSSLFDWGDTSNSNNSGDLADLFLEIILKAYAKLQDKSFEEELARIRMREDRLAALADQRAQSNVALQENAIAHTQEQTRATPDNTRVTDLAQDKGIKEIPLDVLIRATQQQKS